MMPSLVGANMVGPHNHGSGSAYTVDTILNELSRQLTGNARRYSRASNGQQQRVGNAMRISKPGSASNSPRTSTMQARRRTLIGDGFWGGLQTRSPAMEQMYQPSPAPETPSESFYERETTRSARPVSWHPSSQNAQQSLFFSQQEDSNAMLYSYSTYSDAEMLASLQQYPPTPAAYSGYASPAESFSPLSLPYSNYSSQQMCSPQQQQQQQQAQAAFHPDPCSNYASANTLSDTPYLPPPRVADESLSWDAYASSNALNRHTAPPTPEDFAYNMAPQQQQPQQSQQPTKQETTQQHQQAYQPLIHDDDAASDESEGEILYGMGLYDAPDHSKEPSATLHQSVVLSLLGGSGTREQGEEMDTGRGLGLKLEDAWEPPASEDEDEEDDESGDGDSEDDGEGERE